VDGSKVPSERFVICSLKVGNATLENVAASIAPVTGSLLLGQSFLGRFDSWSLDNTRHALILGENATHQDSLIAIVQGFYKALSAGNGELAAKFVLPEKRSGPFSASELSRFYGSLSEPLRLISTEEIGSDTILTQYTFRGNSGSCDGKAIVSIVIQQDGTYISGIRTLNGC
jgi:hypothetical protein